MTTIYNAKKIITMNPTNPEGTHVAVRDGMILGVGSLEDLTGWGEYEEDDSFRDKIIVVHPEDKRYKHLIGTERNLQRV